MSMVSRKRSRLLITVVLAAVLVGSNGGTFGSRAWAGEPDVADQQPGVGQMSLWALLHGILYVLAHPLP